MRELRPAIKAKRCKQGHGLYAQTSIKRSEVRTLARKASTAHFSEQERYREMILHRKEDWKNQIEEYSNHARTCEECGRVDEPVDSTSE